MALVAGGDSRRMGIDKASLRVGDETVLARTARLVGEAGFSRVIAVGRADFGDPVAGAISIPDDNPGRGPLEGIATALRRCDKVSMLFVLPCDLPGLTSEALAWMVASTFRTGGHSPGWTMVEPSGRRQPLVSAWSRSTLPTIESSLVAGNRSVARCADIAGLERVGVPAGHLLAFSGANTPEEWEQLTGSRPSSTR